MNVSIVGSGYVGTTIAACLADIGHDVVNVEIDDEIVATINAGEAPIHESGLEQRIADHAGTNLRATTDYGAVRDTDVTFLCLPTPQSEEWQSRPRDHASRCGVARPRAGRQRRRAPRGRQEHGPARHDRRRRRADPRGRIRNGDWRRPRARDEPRIPPDGDRGRGLPRAGQGRPRDCERGAAATLRELYAPILAREETDLVETEIREAELIKYANNAFLASKVSLVNELGNIAREYDADAYEVLEAVGLDDRVSERFMRSGLGWGGSCFPKDVNAARRRSRAGLRSRTARCDRRGQRRTAAAARGPARGARRPRGARIAVLGLSFKPGTDDVRKSRALDVIEHLRDRGAEIVAYDPVAIENVRPDFPEIEYAESADGALEGPTAPSLRPTGRSSMTCRSRNGTLRRGRRSADRDRRGVSRSTKD